MNYIRITKENIDKEHICCAMSGKQSVVKKEWLRQQSSPDSCVKCYTMFLPFLLIKIDVFS